MHDYLAAVTVMGEMGATLWPIAGSWRAEYGNAYVVLHPSGNITDERGVVLWSWREEGWADDLLTYMEEQL
jgi:hypothetical protein